MAFSTTIKNVSIITNCYTPIRWIERHFLRPRQLQSFKETINFYRSLVPQNALCFDIGANIGEKSEALLMSDAHVVSFEPNPLVLPELKARCSKKKNWRLVASGLGSKASISTLYAREDHGSSGFLKDWQVGIIDTFYVPVVTLDDAIKTFGEPYYCKIDVEGWELEVLMGLSQPIPLLSFEFHLSERDIAKTLSCLDLLLSYGESQINITPAEESRFKCKKWMSLQHFMEWFPGDLKQKLPGYPYGDIFVKNEYVLSAYVTKHDTFQS